MAITNHPAESSSRRRTSRARRSALAIATPYLFILPAFIVFGIFFLFPLLHGGWISLFDWDGLSLGKWAGLANYGDAVTNPSLITAFGHSLVLIFFYSLLPIAVALVLTAIITHRRIRGLTAFRVVMFLPQVIATVVIATTWTAIYAPGGALNQFLGLFGFQVQTRSWLGDFGTALPAVGLIGTWVEIGLCLIVFLAGAQQISPELYEAARMDGAGPIREFFTVVLPGLRRGLSVALTLTVVAALRTFDLVYVATHGGPGKATAVPSYEVYERAFILNQVGSACAVGILLTIVILGITILIRRVEPREDES